jgi:hypothetical protein
MACEAHAHAGRDHVTHARHVHSGVVGSPAAAAHDSFLQSIWGHRIAARR